MPLSFTQEGLWFLDRLGLLGPTYNVPLVTRLEGSLDVAALQRAFAEIVRRHETLRTRFRVVDGQPAQIVDAGGGVPFEVIDLTSRRDENGSGWAGVLRAHADAEFDLAHGPPMRVALLRLGERDHVLAVNLHHIVFDGWSVGVLHHELQALYSAYAAGRESPLPELAAQYADFTLWQRRRLRGAVLERQLAYWRERLRALPDACGLPADRPPPATPSYRGGFAPFRLRAAALRGLDELVRGGGVTPFVVLLAAFQALVARLSGEDDVVVGSPVAGRTHRLTSGLIGYFVNTLVFRTDCSGDPTFRELLRRTAQTVLDAYDHQEVPFEMLVSELRPARTLARQPIYQVAFSYAGKAPAGLGLPGLRCTEITVDSNTAKFDLSLHVDETADGFDGGFEYATDLFDGATVERFADRFTRLLAGALADPDARLSQLPLLSERDRAESAPAWNEPGRDFPPEGCLHELFTAQAVRTPHAVALEYEGERLTYAELDAQSSRLARRLARRLRAAGANADAGVRGAREPVVGVYLERSLDVVVAILGVLKAGAAYLPVDPQYPPERIAYLLGDANAAVLLTHSTLPEMSGLGARVMVLDEKSAGAERRADDDALGEARDDGTRAARAAHPDDLAYVIYTSGSTGQPKGVMIAHHDVVRLLRATRGYFGFGTQDVWTLFHSYAFDFSVWEIFGALLHGGRLVVVPLRTAQSPDVFCELLDRHGVTVLNQTPSAFAQLVRASERRAASPRGLSSLRAVIFGGEALDVSALAPWFARYGDERPVLANMYGITETTVHVTYRRIRAADARTGRSPIGAPMPDLHLYVLDDRLDPVPVGVTGELYVGGAGLARGYLGRPALTAQRFVPNPFAARPGERLYRSGDRARVLPGGDVEYLGRGDRQVKIRGFRVELGEIEAALARVPGVRAAVAAVAGGEESAQRLVAWVVLAPGADTTPAAIRTDVARRLPPYMVPADVAVVAELPLTANGKLDRSRLAQPARARALDVAYEPPATAAEERVAAVFEDVLKVRAGRHDGFFALGGDSMLAVQAAHVASAHGVALTVAGVFRHQTVAALAAALAEPAQAADGALAGALAALNVLGGGPASALADDVEDVYPLSTMQSIMASAYAADRHHRGTYHVQQWFRLGGAAPSAQAMTQALQALVDAHPVLRTRFVRLPGGVLRQAIERRREVVLATHDLSAQDHPRQRRSLEAAILADRADPFGPVDAGGSGSGGLLRFRWFTLSATSAVLLMSIHHAIDDGWGNQHFLTWLFDLYARFARGETPWVAPVPNVFKEYVALEHALRDDPAALAFWRGADLPLTGRSALLRRERGGVGTPHERGLRGASCELVCEGVVSRMYARAKAAGVSIKAIALSAYLELVERELARGPATVGVVSNGRSDRLSDPLSALGLFWNLVPFSSPHAGTSRDEHLCAVQRRLNEVEPFAAFPLTAIRPGRGADDLFFATFNFVNFHNAFRGPAGADVTVEYAGGLDRFHFPLNVLFAVDRPRDRVVVHTEYDPDFFAADVVERLQRRLAELVDARL